MRCGWFLLPVLLVAGCRDTLDLRDGAPISPTPTASATATPTPEPDFGNGQDGELSLSDGAVTTINACSRVVGVTSPDTLELEDATGFEAGDRVLLHQTLLQFALLSDPNPVLPATIGSAGQFELVRIGEVTAMELHLETPTFRTWTLAGQGRVQACTVPEYTSVDLEEGATLAAENWNGVRGGVLAFFASGVATVSGMLDADAVGFRGGDASLDGGTSDVEEPSTSDTEGGGKGEGLDGRYIAAFGRGNRANAAGGGNAHNGGGGGGGNGGAGGHGGFQGEGTDELPLTRGEPGSAVLVSATDRLTFGGGGGGGHQDDGVGTGGARGGGLILIFVDTLRGTGTLSVAGDSASQAPGIDGAGGGGAGGTIVVRAGTSTFRGTIRAPGGQGGSVLGFLDYPAGPGGGGGGGRIAVSASVSAGATIELEGGDAGQLSDGNLFGAENGSEGVLETLQ